MKRLMFVGYGRAGKDEAGEYLAKITPLRFAGTTSKYLTKYVARELGVSEEEAYRDRHQNRMEWKRIGDEIRKDDPTLLIREALQHGEITGGVRDIAEVIAAVDQKLVDIIVWVENNRVSVDPTVTFTSAQADVVIENNWGLEEYHERLRRFAAFGGLLGA